MDYEVTFQPDGKKVKVRPNTHVLDAARRAGVRIPTRCGGKMGCLMCKVHIQDGEQESCLPPKEAERRKLGSLLGQGMRLSCQTVITGNLTVTVPEDPLKAAVRKQLEAARRGEYDEFI
ncbi:2Fe-2S iron-sulfur cluster-binding protein [Paenibacillus sp. N3/727]|uniref:2Fe-2S iron-sulfur cluster-binding protein n=1 Tax=Paenibacillus sp. N3/727 TaxID=2925845 RepID=UPI001F5334E2|nr:2Fe-2S iron-sulfur cluster-binding protein [Paenibacillus sp. N3/727]UNK20507.1 2Fe-2S iron-sulfur cluster-binding protein [Paenibacillus sp. N3/727]